jgi:PAS domain S-box-containing protein
MDEGRAAPAVEHAISRRAWPLRLLLFLRRALGRRFSGAPSREQRLAALVEHGQDALFLCDGDGTVRYVTPNLKRLFGREEGDVLGRHVEELFNPVDQGKLRQQIALLEAGRPVRLRLRLHRGDERGLHWVQVEMEDGRGLPDLGAILIQLRDLTPIMEFEAAVIETEDSLRRSEAFYRMIIEGSSDLVLLLDSQRRVLFASQAARALLGRAPEELRGRLIDEAIAEEDRARALGSMEAARRKEWAHLRVRLLHSNGSRPLAEVHGRFTQDPDGHQIFVVSARDVTREDAAERRALEEGRLEAVGRLAGGVAHDFNNLLTVIQGNAELALMDQGAATPGRLREVVDASTRAGQLVQQLLSLGRKQAIQARSLDLGELLAEHEGLLRRVLGAGVRLRLRLPEQALAVMAEPVSLARALFDLAAFARESMPEGGVYSVDLVRHVVDAKEAAQHSDRALGAYVRLDLRDSGRGLDAEERARLFEPYVSVGGRGGGLGLSTVLGLVRQLGGYLSVESRPGEGCLFSLCLPESGEAVAAAPVPAPAAAAGPADGRCILVVDDEEPVRRLATDALRLRGFQVLEAADGEEALALWREAKHHRHRVDLVLSDVVMPRLNGAQLLEQLQVLDAGQRCLLMSGFHNPDKIALGGRTVGLAKPFTVQKLYEAVDAALARPAGGP